MPVCACREDEMAHLERSLALSQPPAPGQPYSVAIPGSQKPGRSSVYRHFRFAAGVMTSLDPNGFGFVRSRGQPPKSITVVGTRMVQTAHEMFESTATRLPHNRCLGWRPYDGANKSWGPYVWMDYATVQRRRANLGAGLVAINKQAGVQESQYGVGIWSQNRPEWQLTDLACMSQSLYSVSLYDTLGPDTSEHILNHASIPCMVTTLPHIPTLLKMKARTPALKVVVSMDPLEHHDPQGHSKHALLNDLASAAGVRIYALEEVEAIGASLGTPAYRPPSPHDIITINYTSGTTGQPKGVVLLHKNAVAAASTALASADQNSHDTLMSCLPLAHIFARMAEHGMLWAGGGIGYFHGDILALVDDLKVLKPSIFCLVPRLANRFGGAIRAATVEQPGFKGSLSRHVVETKLANMDPPDKPGATNTHALYDRLWSRKVASALGLENIKLIVSGSAPLDPKLHRFLRTVIGGTFMQGYGLTETYAQALGQLRGDFSVGTCGAVAPTLEVCLMDVPDMQYYSSDRPQPRGELLVRGSNLFAGYFRDPQQTAEVMTSDGWFKTGDIASIDSRGRVQVIDRVKNVLKLAQGEYISPERLENIYLSHLGYLAMAFVHGDSVQDFLVGIFAVQPDMFAPWASKLLRKQIAATEIIAIKEACRDVRVVAAVQADLDRVGRENKFAGYERVRRIRLMVDPFTIANELLTPTLKLKRPVAAKVYRADLDELYAEAIADQNVSLKAKL